jgi:ribonucleotide monophosphatase NagD (HAD superfamily)
LDCDGVIYKAGKLIENSREAIKKLYDMKKKVYYLSNASDKS